MDIEGEETASLLAGFPAGLFSEADVREVKPDPECPCEDEGQSRQPIHATSHDNRRDADGEDDKTLDGEIFHGVLLWLFESHS